MPNPKWPHDNQAERNAFYGNPANGEIADQLVPVVPPFQMYFDGKPISKISFHQKAAPALAAALNEIWDYYGHDQAKIDAAGVSKYAGAYNHRMVRGSKTKWSNHAYGCAIDLNAEENGLNTKGNMPQPVIDAFCRQGWMWGGWYKGRKDPMHFEAVDNGGRTPSADAPAPSVISVVKTAPASTSTARTTGIGMATVALAGQAASVVTGPVQQTVETVNQVQTTSGQVIETTKQVAHVVPDGFWVKVLAFLQSPLFLSLALLIVIGAWATTYYLRKRKEVVT